MPYFQWKGIDLVGDIHRGATFSSTYEQLEKDLLHHNIALLDASERSQKRVVLPRKILLPVMKQVSVLLESGLLVPEALAIVATQIHELHAKHFMEMIVQRVQAGESLGAVMETLPDSFPPLVIASVYAGEASGGLGKALNRMCTYMEKMDAFYKTLQSALLLPLVILGFFLLIAGILLTIIIPHFASVMRSVGSQIPWSTQVLLHISAWCTSWQPLILVSVILSGIIGIRIWYAYDTHVKRIFDAFLLSLPGIGRLVSTIQLMHFFAAVSILLERMVPLVDALHLASKALSNAILAEHCERIISLVASGYSLGDALRENQAFFDHETLALIHIGEESGKMASMSQCISDRAADFVQQKLSLISVFLQPMLLVILGCLIAALIMAIYVPIFTISDSVGFGSLH